MKPSSFNVDIQFQNTIIGTIIRETFFFHLMKKKKNLKDKPISDFSF